MAWPFCDSDLQRRLRLAAEARGRLAYHRGLPPPLSPPRWVRYGMRAAGGAQAQYADRAPSEAVGWRVAALAIDAQAPTAKMVRARA